MSSIRKLTRRRTLAILAGCIGSPADASESIAWQGHTMESEARIVLSGHPREKAFRVFARIESIIARVERQFSLHTDSAIARLNASGQLRHPDEDMLAVLDLSDAMHRAAGGVFDPTVQPLWLALARGEDPERARAMTGWPKVKFFRDGVYLERGMQLTLNGIAQGFCADKVAAFLRTEGYDHVLIDTGELLALGTQAGGEPWPVTLAGPDDVAVGRIGISNRALATSSPAALRLAKGEAHILNPNGAPPVWNTVSISAPSAAVADALSTACCLLDRAAAEHAVAQFPGARLEAMV